MKKIKAVRYDENPFIEGMTVPIKNQRIRLSRLGRDDNVLINQSTGEMQGTHVTTFRRVDSQEFIKLFTNNIALTFELKTAGIKAFGVLVWMLQEKGISKDLVPLDKLALDDFLEANKEKKIALSLPTFARGLTELESAQIIAKHLRQGWYFINPNLIFNGDRIAFTTVIQRRRNEKKDDSTLDMFDDSNEFSTHSVRP
nr:replication/maintenance protein RepL [Bartonella tribocorum]